MEIIEILQDYEDEVSDEFLRLGIPCGLLGYRYLRRAIAYTMRDSSLTDEITGRLYPMVAEDYQTRGQLVERAIRHAIEVSFDRCDPDTITSYFGNTISCTKGKVTNREFIALVADKLLRKLRHENVR